MERTIAINGRPLLVATTYDGDSQYHVQIKDGDKLITEYKVAATQESDVFTEAQALVEADIELGNLKM
ncbi:hypothetical protein LOK74_07340 [Brevibacillus humidisoli]|uniref:hypothetical protein n=1 Tax=Brevibacillus humidisoli TaxID=2895522 RepID=UPI001E356977|nr:hypothetical protein [Brevibacillus humidisoli]UFJ42295.1 hypothetical protein LOK74_07340 [Brevibacillus humidisoli]